MDTTNFHPPWADMFPLEVTPFEYYMILDQLGGCAMTTVSCWVFRGRIDRERFQTAFMEAIRHEPVFWCKIVRRGRQFFWNADFSRPPELRFRNVEENVAAGQSGELPTRIFDLEKEPGADFLVEESPGEVAVHFRVHHALGDMLGMQGFMESWLAAYERLGNPAGEFPPTFPEPEMFPQRGKMFAPPAKKRSVYEKIRSAIRELKRFAFMRPWILAGKKDAEFRETRELPRSFWFRLEPAVREKYADAGKALGVSVNVLLMRDMFLTLRRWQENLEETGRLSWKKNMCFRILVPISLRDSQHERLPCTNVVGYFFCDLPPGRCADGKETAAELQEMTLSAIQSGRRELFLKVIRVLMKIPGAMRRITSVNNCHCTVVLSNLGVLWRNFRNRDFQARKNLAVTDLELRCVVFTPPVRETTSISVGVATHGEEMTVSFNVTDKYMDAESAEAFIGEYLEQIKRTVEGNNH